MESLMKFYNFRKTFHHQSVFRSLTIWSDEEQLPCSIGDDFI